MNTIGERIKYIRENAHITKSELARRIDVSPAYITMLENGKKENPSLEVLKKIVNALDTSLDNLLHKELQEGRIQFIKDYYGKNPDDKKISNIVKKINSGELLSDEDIKNIDDYKKADVIASDFDTEGVPCVRGPEQESFELFKKLLKSLGYTNGDLGTSEIILFTRIKAQIELEVKMATTNKE